MKQKEKNAIFLLGGHDLEMEAIKQTLEREGIAFADHNLNWGAQLSSYRKEIAEAIEKGQEIYGIELEEDMPLPKRYYRIDHHNGFSANPSSIEQVCELLGIQPTRLELLIAANDKGYIPALRAAGATSAEIADIRKADRRLSGCTDKDEANIFAPFKVYTSNNVIFVAETATSKFAPFIDSHFCESALYLVAGPEGPQGTREVQLSGHRAMKWLDTFKLMCPGCWYGGGRDGFIGGYMTTNKFTELKEMFR